MNMNDKRVRKVVSIIVLVIVVAMVATSVLPALLLLSGRNKRDGSRQGEKEKKNQ